jgi:hypothetical protein
MLGERGSQVCKRLVYVPLKANTPVVGSEVYGSKGPELVQAKKTGAGACTENKGQFIVGLIVASDLK